MQRREFIAVLGGVATWPVAWAQQGERMRRIGVLMPTGDDDAEGRARAAAFVEGLREVGLTEGRNVKLDYRWGGTDVERLRTLASELVALTPDVFLAGSSPPMAALPGRRRQSPSCSSWYPIPSVRALSRAWRVRAPILLGSPTLNFQ
jgi:putative tryptophan/tyrosine transport system substrate-binding protein